VRAEEREDTYYRDSRLHWRDSNMKADAKTRAAVLSTLNRFADAYALKDQHAVQASFAPDSDVVCIGTGPDEVRIGPAAIRAQVCRDLAQTDAIALSFKKPIVSVAGHVAWFTAECSIRITASGRKQRFTARFTAVLEQRNKMWVIVQMHVSLPATGQPESRSVLRPT
jgi:ketosteroid isomerase-like protein